MLLDKKNLFKICLILISLLTYFKNVFGIASSEIVSPPVLSGIGCPFWEAIAQDIDISNVTLVSPNVFRIERKISYLRVWSVYIENIRATSQEEALIKAKNILGALPPSRSEYVFSPGGLYYYGYIRCFFSNDIFMYSME